MSTMNKFIFLVSLFFYSFFSFFQTADTNEKIIEIKTTNVKKKKLSDQLNLTGTLKANENVDITSVVSEKIKEIKFKEGSFVKKNQILVELENNEEKALLKQVEAELDEAKLNFTRTMKLVEEGNASQAMLDKRLKEKRKYEGQYEEVVAKINDRIIKTPFDGMISTKNFSVGSFVKPGDVITSLYDIQKIKVDLYIPEIYSQKIKNNQTFKLSILSDDDVTYGGKIYAIDPFINKKTRNFKASGIIDKNDKLILRPGMMAEINIFLDERNVFTVPEGSIIQENEKTFVYLIKDSSSYKKEVKIGKRKKGLVEIVKGLNTGDKVVYEGTNKIKDGSKIIEKR